VLPQFGYEQIASISTDEVRLELMIEFMKKNQKTPKDKAFDKVEKKAKETFDKRIKVLL